MLERFFRRQILKRLNGIQYGCLVLTEVGQAMTFGDPRAELRARIDIRDSRAYRQIGLRGDVGAAESYIVGDWDCDNLTALIRIMIANLATVDQMGRGVAAFRRLAASWFQALHPNDRRRARQRIHRHYDLGNEFFSLFLDSSMCYSSALFRRPDQSLEEASYAKLERACEKLQLAPGQRLLEIGTGWGSLAIFAAKHYGCRVTTTTISDAQFRMARQRVSESGLDDQITVLHSDYRDLQGKFDRIVAIEMIEALGHEYFGRFFAKCDELIEDDGLMLLQGIVIRDQRFRYHIRNVDFIRKYIFPGGCLPSTTALLQAMTRASQFRLVHLEDIVAHYPPTLRAWRGRFEENMAEIERLGMDEAFLKMWRYYLCYCEAAFMQRQVNNLQLLFAGPQSRIDVTRWGLPALEAGFGGSDTLNSHGDDWSSREDHPLRDVAATSPD